VVSSIERKEEIDYRLHAHLRQESAVISQLLDWARALMAKLKYIKKL